MYLGDVLSFALMQKKDSKEKIKAALPGLLRHCHLFFIFCNPLVKLIHICSGYE